jgi:sugar phosphate isomerase/epimerase
VTPRGDSGWTLTGFADEAGPDLAEQIALFSELGLTALDLRSAWGTNVISMSEAQITEAKALLDGAGIAVSSVASPIGKISITGDFDRHLAKAEHAAHLARVLDTPYVRVFSFFIPAGDDPDTHRDEVLRRMAALAEVAERHDVVFVHENEKDIYGDIPRRCLDIVESVGSPHLRLAFDPANYVQCGVRPFTDAYPLVRPYVDYMHIKDAVFGSGDVRVAGEGDGEVREIIRALRADGFSGYFSIEPHLGSFDAFGGQCGPDLWRRAHEGFVAMLRDEGMAFR